MNLKTMVRSETDADVSAITDVTIAAFKTLEISNQTKKERTCRRIDTL